VTEVVVEAQNRSNPVAFLDRDMERVAS